METEKSEIVKKAKKLVLEAKKKKAVKPYNIAFEEFPVEKEIHKGNMKDYK